MFVFKTVELNFHFCTALSGKSKGTLVHSFFTYRVNVSITPKQCGQIGRFLKILVINLLTKVSKIFFEILGNFMKPCNLTKMAVVTFWVPHRKFWATFYFYIWSHCSQSKLQIILQMIALRLFNRYRQRK